MMNDTVAQLAASAYEHGPDCIVGVVVGNGCNASYLDDVATMKRFNLAASGYTFDKVRLHIRKNE